MTIIYNKHTPDYYLVASMDKVNLPNRKSGNKTRKLTGDFVVISSDQKVNNPLTSGYTKTMNAVKKTFLLMTLIAAIPFSSVLATTYIRLLVNAKMS